MKPNQKSTPKYWVGHDKSNDEVFTDTMHKSKSDTAVAMATHLGVDWQIDDDLEIILIEVKKVI